MSGESASPPSCGCDSVNIMQMLRRLGRFRNALGVGVNRPIASTRGEERRAGLRRIANPFSTQERERSSGKYGNMDNYFRAEKRGTAQPTSQNDMGQGRAERSMPGYSRMQNRESRGRGVGVLDSAVQDEIGQSSSSTRGTHPAGHAVLSIPNTDSFHCNIRWQ